MKVLHVTASIDPALGGVSQAIQTIIKGLASHGVISEVVCLDQANADHSNSPFTVHALGPAKGPWAYSPLLLPWLEKNLNSFDAVILHGLWLYHGYGLYKALKQLEGSKHGISSPSFFVMPHGMLDPYFQKASTRKIKAIRNLIYWKLIESKIVNLSSGLLFTCESEKLLARTTFKGYHPRSEKIVSLGVEQPPAFDHKMQAEFGSKHRNNFV